MSEGFFYRWFRVQVWVCKKVTFNGRSEPWASPFTGIEPLTFLLLPFEVDP
jgi:hypothetical protein